MFYILTHQTNNETQFFSCNLEEFEGWLNISWLTGEEIDSIKLPKILRYRADNLLLPEDFPLTSYTGLLVSNRISGILKKSNISGLQYFDSEIVQPNGNVIQGFYTINILNELDCLDKSKSKFQVKTLGPALMYKFKKIVFDESKIPKEARLFRIKESTNVFVDQSLKDTFTKEKITGIKLTPISEGDPVLGNYDEE
jgi:hypothetical protein